MRFGGAAPSSGELGLQWFENAGHSIAGGGGARYVPEGGYANRLRSALGIPRFRDFSIGGAVACWPNGYTTGDGGYAHILQHVFRPGMANMGNSGAPYVAASQLVNIHFGLNDLAALGSQNPKPFQTGLRTIMSRFCASSVYEHTSAAWAFTGAWALLGITPNTASASGDGIYFTQTVNDKVTFTVPADYPGGLVVGIGLWLNGSWGTQTYGLNIDGVSRPDVVLTGLTDTSAAAKHIVHTLRLGTGVGGDATLAAGAHTIELTFKAGSGLVIDEAHIETDPLDGPLLLMPLPHKPAGYSLWNTWARGPNAATDPINDAAVDAWKTAQRAVQAEFPGRVIEVDIDATAGLIRSTAASGDYIGDGAHPNDRGHAKIALAAKNAVLASGLITDRLRNRPSVVTRPDWKYVSVTNGAGAFYTGWSNYGAATGTLPNLRWRKDENGRVTIQGAIKAAAGATPTVVAAGTLPKPLYAVDAVGTQYDGTAMTLRGIRIQSSGTLDFTGAAIVTTAGNVYTFSLTYDSEQTA